MTSDAEAIEPRIAGRVFGAALAWSYARMDTCLEHVIRNRWERKQKCSEQTVQLGASVRLEREAPLVNRSLERRNAKETSWRLPYSLELGLDMLGAEEFDVNVD